MQSLVLSALLSLYRQPLVGDVAAARARACPTPRRAPTAPRDVPVSVSAHAKAELGGAHARLLLFGHVLGQQL